MAQKGTQEAVCKLFPLRANASMASISVTIRTAALSYPNCHIDAFRCTAYERFPFKGRLVEYRTMRCTASLNVFSGKDDNDCR